MKVTVQSSLKIEMPWLLHLQWKPLQLIHFGECKLIIIFCTVPTLKTNENPLDLPPEKKGYNCISFKLLLLLDRLVIH